MSVSAPLSREAPLVLRSWGAPCCSAKHSPGAVLRTIFGCIAMPIRLGACWRRALCTSKAWQVPGCKYYQPV